MRSRCTWLLSLGFAALGFTVVGCGGSDVPNPDADSNAGAPPAAAAPNPGVAQAEAPAMPDPTADPAQQAAAAVAAPSEAPKAEMTAAPEPTAPEPAAEAPARTEGSGSTAELLALGTKPAPESAPAAADAAATPGAPGAEAPGAIGSAEAPAAAGDLGAEQAKMLAAASGAPAPGIVDAAAMPAAPGLEPAGAAGGEIPGYPDAGGDDFVGGGGAGSNETGYHSPFTAVNSFLKALKARNAEKLAEATAMRAPREASGVKNQKLFASILEQSLTEDDLNDLANKLEGFKVIGNNAPKSTGRFSIILQKPGKNGESYRRTITARHEKAGWKVVDISGLGKIEKPMMMRGRMSTGRRR